MSAAARNSDGRHARPAWIPEERMMQTSVAIIGGGLGGLYAGRLLDSAGGIDVWKDGHHAMRPAMKAGAISLFDMRYHWEGDNMAPFEALNFFIPISTRPRVSLEVASQLSATMLS